MLRLVGLDLGNTVFIFLYFWVRWRWRKKNFVYTKIKWNLWRFLQFADGDLFYIFSKFRTPNKKKSAHSLCLSCRFHTLLIPKIAIANTRSIFISTFAIVVLTVRLRNYVKLFLSSLFLLSFFRHISLGLQPWRYGYWKSKSHGNILSQAI